MAQLTYSLNGPVGHVGQLADSGPNKIETCYHALSAGIAPGLAVTRDADQKMKMASADSDPIYGVVLSDGINRTSYAVGEAMPVLRFGSVWVTVEDAVDAGDDVFARFTAATGAPVGGFRSDADSAKALEVEGMRFASTAGAGALVKLEVNLLGS